MTDRTVNPFAPIPTANEKIARRVVDRTKNFQTTPFGATWHAFAISEVLAALNDASRRSG
jgi:hypothetical protein